MQQKAIVLASRVLLLILLSGFGIAPPAAHGAETATAGDFVGAEGSLPSYVRIIAAGGEAETRDSLYYADAGCTIYRVNKTVLDRRSPLCLELLETVLPLARREGWTLEAIELRGAASPEGPYLNNKRLAEGRAHALHAFLAEHLPPEATAATRIITVPEDYDYLLWLLKRRADGAAPVVEQLMARYGSDPQKIKPALKQVGGGAMWRRLVADYYPALRNGRVMFWFSRTPEPEQPRVRLEVAQVAPLPAPVVDVPQLSFSTAMPPATRTLERRHVLALSSNLLYDAFWMPNFGWAPMLNIAAEFFPARGRFTYRAAFTSPYYHRWGKQKFFQIRDYHLEVRRYFNPGPLHTGAYLAAYVNASKYGIGLGPRKGWKGEGGGAALKAGYVLPLGSGRWRLDFHVAAGGFYTRFDPYVWGNPVTGDDDGRYYYDYTGPISSFTKRNHRRWWLGPTEVGVTLTFDLLYKRIARGGVSTRRKEVVVP